MNVPDMVGQASTLPSAEQPAQACVDASADFDAIYRAHFHEVYRWVTYLGGARRDADDLTQNVFEVVLARLARFDGRNLKGWLYTITRKTVAGYRRGAWVRRWLRGEEQALDLFVAPGESAEQALSNRNLAERALAQMSDKLRVAFILFEIDGYTPEEIAGLLDLRPSTVYSRLRLAREKFLALLGQIDKDGST